MRAPLTWIHKLAFGAGAAGWALGDRLLMTFALYFYSPPANSGLSERLPIAYVLGIALPLWGLISVFGRVIDGLIDPLVASWTDRSTHPFGRRRIFMLAGVLPLAIGTAAVFFPPVDGPSWANVFFVAFALAFYFCAFTLYACPLQALLPDLARTERERMDLSTVQAIAMLVGAAIVMIGAPIMLGALHELSGSSRYATIAVGFASLSFLFMLAPILLIPERKLVESVTPATVPLIASVVATLRAPGMSLYLMGTIALWFGFNTVASGVPYFVTVLMQQPEAYAATVLTATFGVAALCFPLVNLMAKRITKRRTMILGGASLAVVMCLVPLIHDATTGLIVMGLAGFPVAVLMSVPNALLADLAAHQARVTGENREAMFFGTQAFFLKVNLGVSAGLLAAMLNLGKSVANPLGVQLVGPTTAGVLLVTVVCFWRFAEPRSAA